MNHPPYTCMLMEDGLVHRVAIRVDSHHYRIACDTLLFDHDENGSIVLEPLTCLVCAAARTKDETLTWLALQTEALDLYDK